MRSLVLISMGMLLATVAIAADASGVETQIVATGVGIATARPDYVNVVVWIRATEKTATKSTRHAATIYQELVRKVGAVGVAPSDIITQRFSVGQQWKRDKEGRPKEFVGYRTSHQLRIRVRDPEKVGEVIDASIAAGAHSIDKIQFASTKADSAQRVALAQAVRDARERAEIMAAAAGGKLGSLVEIITEEAARARGGMLRVERAMEIDLASACAGDVGTTLVPGALTQRVVVLGTWKLLEGD